ncbi:MAG: TRAP transporter small permease [candidate division NC10 bacterium]
MRKLVEGVNRGAEILTQVFLAVMVVVVFTQVIFRFFIHQPISWSEEVARYVFVGIIWMGAAAVVREDGHPGMDLLTRSLPPVWQRGIQLLVNLMVVATLVTVAVTGARLAYDNMSQPSPAMELPMGIPYAAIPLSAAIMVLNVICYVFFPKKAEGDRRRSYFST